MKGLVVIAAITAISSSAAASVERYAIVVGNNEGAGDEVTLRYAESDAQRLYDILTDIGDFSPENVVLLRGSDAGTVQRTIIALNERIRTRRGGSHGLLLVFYSGHGDADSLHLGDTSLGLKQLEQLVRGSAAELRLLVLDSCRSGSLTRVKGGHAAPPLSIKLDERLTSEGAVFLTSSSANEDSQESDELRGSFFAHYLLSGLVGAADKNGDGTVTLAEAYGYAYDNTLRASSRTLAGTQHPTFRYDLHGRGGFGLTRIGHARRRGLVDLPKGRSFLLFEKSASGAVVAEVGVRDRRRMITVRAGRYFVRGRGRDDMLEGTVDVAAGQRTQIRNGDLRRIAYARLVRKGGIQVVHGPQVGYRMRTALNSSSTPCHGMVLGYNVGYPAFNIVPRIGACRGRLDNETLTADVDQFDVGVRLAHAWDFSAVTVETGVSAAAALLRQTFSTRGVAPDRNSVAGVVGASVAVVVDLPRGHYLHGELAAQTYFFNKRVDESADKLTSSFALATALVVGKHW